MGYRVPVLEKFSWQEPVLAILKDAIPANPTKGDRYIVPVDSALTATINGVDNVSVAGAILWYAGEKNPLNNSNYGWQIDKPKAGWKVYVEEEKCDYHYDVTVIPSTEDDQPDTTVETWSNKARMSGLILDGDVDSTSTHVNWLLKDQEENSLTFKVKTETGETPVMNFDTTYEVTGEGDDATVSKQRQISVTNANVFIDGNLVVTGTSTEVKSSDLKVNDRLITLNKNGLDETARDAGIEIEGTGAKNVGYIKSTEATDLPGYKFLAPGSDLEFSIKIDDDSTDESSENDRTLTKNAVILLTDLLNREDNVFTIDQGLSTIDNVKFADLDITGDATFAKTVKIAQTLDVEGVATVNNNLVINKHRDNDTDPVVNVLTVNTNAGDDEKALSLTGNAQISKTLTVDSTVSIDNDKIKISENAIEVQNATQFKDAKGNHVTVEEMYEAYNNRAKYDCALGCIVFDSDKVTRVDCTEENDPYWNGGSTNQPDPVTITEPAGDTIDLANGLKFKFSEAVTIDQTLIKLNDTAVVDVIISDDFTELTINDQLTADTDYTLTFEDGAVVSKTTTGKLAEVSYTFHTDPV